MTNVTYFIGTELDAITPVSLDGFAEGSGPLAIDQTLRGGIDVARNGCFDIFPCDYTTNGLPTAVSNIWLHFRGRLQDNPDQATWVQFYGTSGTVVARMETRDQNNVTYIRMTYWNGSAWVAIGDWSNFYGRASVATFDIHIKVGSAGKMEWYVEGTLVYSQVLDTTVLTNITRVRLGAARYDYDNTWFGEIIVANYPTLGHRVRRRTPTGNGTYTDWTGDYTAVDDFGVADTDSVFTDTVGSRESYTSFTMSDSGNPIKAVAVAARIRIDDESPVRGHRPLLVINGNEYVSPAPLPASSGLHGSEWVFDKNPATNGDWTIAAVNASEFGVKASDGGSN